MKNLIYTTLLIASAMCVSVNAQNKKTGTALKQVQPVQAAELVTPSAKSNFINNQNYLSKSALVDFKVSYGDSLIGFDEEDVKTRLLGSNAYGNEYINAMKANKRSYINAKYNLGSNTLQARTRNTTPANSFQNTQSSNPGGRQIGGNNTTMALPCINEGFEQTPVGQYSGAANATAITGWTLSSYTQGSGGCANNAWQPGCPEAWIVNTPILGIPGLGTLPHSPLGGTNVLKLQDVSPTGLQSKIVQTFPVTSNNTLFQFAFAGAWESGGHQCCEQPSLKIAMYDCNGAPLTCSSLSLNAVGGLCNTGSSGYSVTAGGVSWTNWQVKYIDLTPFVGSCVTLELINGDCTLSGHYGSLYLDTQCGGQVIGVGLGGIGGNISGPVSFCAGSNQAIIAAPLGYASYQWISPQTGVIPPSQGGAASTYTIINPVPNSVYTVNLTTGSGCHFTSTNTITTSNVNIQAIGAGPTCMGGGAAGTATVVGNGSGTGYTYNWVNSSNVPVGTTSVITGLTAGLYSVTIGGLGVAGCGSATGTVVVGVTATPTTGLLKPYCAGTGGASNAYLQAPLAGTNFQWYSPGPVAINGALGGNASTYTVVSPSNNTYYWLTYQSIQGCKDSVRYTLISSPPGALTIPSPGTVCPGGANGSPTITLFPATGSPMGQNAFTVTNISAPAYTSMVGTYNSNTYTPSGLAAGSYNVLAFDGSCKYSSNFSVATLTFNFNLNPSSYTLCSGTNTIASMMFPTPPALFQYTYNWTPSLFLSGNAQSTIIMSPVVAPGTFTTITYTATATSSLMNCPVSKTVALTVINPTVPVISPIPNLCDSQSPYQINITPGGGVFTTTFNPGSLIGPTSGIISPNLANLGVNTFTYMYSVNICSIQATGSFHVSHFNPATLTSSISPVCVTGNTVNLMNIVQSTAAGTWSAAIPPTPPASPSPTNGLFTGGPGNFTFDPSAVVFNGSSPSTKTIQLTYNTTSTPIASVCPAHSTLIVSVTNTVMPVIASVNDICTKDPVFNLTANPGGGTWSGNGIPVTGVVTPSNLAGGAINVVYTVIDGACTNTSNIVLNVTQFVPATFSGPLPAMCASNAFFDLESIANFPGGTWSGPGITNTSFIDPNLASLVPAPQIYVHTFTSPLAGCGDTKTISTIVTPTIQSNIAAIGPHCNAEAPFQLSVSPNTGSWVPTQYLTAGGLFTPSLAVVGNNAVQYVIGSSTCNLASNAVVSVEGFIPAATTSSVLPDNCVTSALVNLSAYALNAGGSWSGPGVNGISFDPSVTGPGTFQLLHSTQSSPSGLCPDQAIISVNVFSLSPPVLSRVGPICNSAAPRRLQPSPAGGIFGGANTMAITNDGLFNPAQANFGDNIISYSITLGPCVAYANTTITVEKFVSADLSKYPDAAYCINSKPIGLDQFVQNTGGTWGGPGVSNGMFNFAQASVGKNVVYYQTSSATPTLCPDTSAIAINVEAPQPVNIMSDRKNGCAPLSVLLYTDRNTLNGVGKWSINDGSEGTGTSKQITLTTPGSYTVVFTMEGTCTVQKTLDVPITVYENPKPNFTFPDEIMISNPEVQFTNLTTESTKNQYAYQWRFSNTNTSTDVSPLVTFPSVPGRYTATLTATSIHGCKNDIVKTLELKNEFNIFIPTAFTPNFDRINNEFLPVFTPYGLDEKTFEMEIFDRWGTLLFRSKDITKGWDGSIQNKGTELLKEDVYVYKIKYKDMEGNVYSKIGHVSLIK